MRFSRPHLVAAICCGLTLACATGAFAAPLQVQHESATLTDDDGDGVFRPGDLLSMFQTVRSTDTVPLLELRGAVSAGGTGVTYPSGSTRTFPVLAPGATGTNATPFAIGMLASYECGLPLTLSVTMMDGAPIARDRGEEVALPPITYQTGLEGPVQTHASGDVPKALVDSGTSDSSLQITEPGRIKRVRVKVASLTHPATGELELRLVAPDNTEIALSTGRGGAGDNFTGTVFAAAGTPISAGSAPFTGTFAADGNLASLAGKRQDGAWKLRVVDTTSANTGTIEDWSLEITPASCATGPVPAFDATPDPADPGETVQFDASASTDPTGTIVKYEWDLDGMPGFEVDTGASPNAAHAFSTLGSYDVALRVTSSSGLEATAHRLVSVSTPPTAAFDVAPASPQSGQEATLDASASSDSDPGDSIVAYDWDLDGNGSFETQTDETEITHTWPQSGDKTVRLRVTDSFGASDVAAAIVVVQNRAPVAALDVPDPASTGQPETFDAAGSSDDDGTIVKYEWDLDGDGTYEQDTGDTPSAEHTYGTIGARDVALRVTDNEGATDEVTEQVQVAQAPQADLIAAPSSAKPGAEVEFDASGSTDDSAIVSYEWDFDGDGTFSAPSATATTTHAYAAPDDYDATVRVTDDEGATATATAPVDIFNQLPTASILAAPSPVVTGATVVFDASGTIDPDGTITKYEWDLDGGGGFELSTGAAPAAARSYPNPGVVIARVRVTDDTLGTSTALIALTIGASVGAAGAGGGTPGQAGAAPGGGSSLTNPAGLVATLGGAETQRLKAITKSGVQLTCRSNMSATCSVALEVAPRDAVKLKLAKKPKGKQKAKPVIVGRASVTTGSGDAPLAVALNAKLKRALKRGKRVKVTARAAAIAGTSSTTAARTVTLRK